MRTSTVNIPMTCQLAYYERDIFPYQERYGKKMEFEIIPSQIYLCIDKRMSFERMRYLSSEFDRMDESIPITERIYIYSEMLTYEDLKSFALESITKLYEDLIYHMDYRNIEILKNVLYDFGIEFIYVTHQKTIYSDGENVHTTVSSTTKVALKLMKDYPGLEYKRPLELSVYSWFFNMIESETYHAFDPKVLFMSIWKFIMNNEYKDDMILRLKEELEDSNGLCMTGCIVRLMNSIRGFGYEKYETKLDDYEYEKSKMFNVFNRELKNYVFDTRIMNVRLKELLNSKKILLSDKHDIDILRSYTGINWSKINSIFDFND